MPIPNAKFHQNHASNFGNRKTRSGRHEVHTTHRASHPYVIE